jgi:hypothetical protein
VRYDLTTLVFRITVHRSQLTVLKEWTSEICRLLVYYCSRSKTHRNNVLFVLFCLFYFIIFCFILFFYFILFYFILFYFILFYFILFYFILFYFILFCFVLFCFVLFCLNDKVFSLVLEILHILSEGTLSSSSHVIWVHRIESVAEQL